MTGRRILNVRLDVSTGPDVDLTERTDSEDDMEQKAKRQG